MRIRIECMVAAGEDPRASWVGDRGAVPRVDDYVKVWPGGATWCGFVRSVQWGFDAALGADVLVVAETQAAILERVEKARAERDRAARKVAPGRRPALTPTLRRVEAGAAKAVADGEGQGTK